MSRLNLTRLLACLGLLFCGATLADGWQLSLRYCGFQSDCDAVRDSEYGAFAGVSLGWWGCLGFATSLAGTLTPRFPKAARKGLAGAMLLAGVGLLLIQALVLQKFCPVCLLVDGSAIALAVLLWGVQPRELHVLPQLLWPAAGLLSFAAPILMLALAPLRPIPREVQAHWQAGRITLVEVTDFDCDYCQRAEPVIQAFLEAHPQVRRVLLVAPLPRHAHARPAARAYLAALNQNRGEAMAQALFRTRDRGPEGCRKLAEQLQLDLARYDADVADPAGEEALQATLRWAQRAGSGLPLLWLNDRDFRGLPTLADLEEALRALESQ